MFIAFLYSIDSGWQKVLPVVKKIIIVLPIFGIIFSLLYCAVPDRNWIIALAVNSQVTPKNLEVAGDALINAKNEMKKDFIDIAQSLNKENKTEEAADKK